MAEKPVKIDAYVSDNLRFRKAYIRERLVSLKTERDALMAERERINGELIVKKDDSSEMAASAV